MEQNPQRVYLFGPFRLDPAERLLFLDDRSIPLTPKAFETLLVLLKNSGHLVTKEELLRQVWPDTFVEEATLAKNVFTVRKALGEQADDAIYIETVPKIGYRFVATVKTEEKNGAQAATSNATSADTLTPRSPALPSVRRQAPNWKLWLTGAILATIALGLWTAYVHWGNKPAPGVRTHHIQSLAVLPLANLSGDASQDFFADGMTDELITVLTELRSLEVTSRTSSVRYRKSNAPLPQIAQELHVDAIVEGAVVRSGNNVRITAQLVEGANDRHIWAGSYERPLADALSIQRDIAREIARQIQIQVSPPEQAWLQRRQPLDPEAQEEYLLGRYYWNRRDPLNLKQAVSHFQKSISIDSRYPAAYAGLADCYLLLPIYSNYSAREAMLRAKAAAQEALRLDDSLAEAHTSLAYVLQYEWNFDAAEKEYLRALQLGPGYATAHQWYGEFLRFLNREDEALQQSQIAMRLDPFSPIIHMEAALPYYYRRQYDEAVRHLKQALEIDPTFAPTHGQLGYMLLQQSNYDEALREFQLASDHGLVDSPWIMAGVGAVYARSGNKQKALKYVERLKSMSRLSDQPWMLLAGLLVELKRYDEAFQWFERARSAHHPGMVGIGIEPRMDPLRNDPRFKDLVRRLQLPPGAIANSG